ncbi:hypothetical protein ACPTFL_15515, partial [Enterococcus faecalis]
IVFIFSSLFFVPIYVGLINKELIVWNWLVSDARIVDERWVKLFRLKEKLDLTVKPEKFSKGRIA